MLSVMTAVSSWSEAELRGQDAMPTPSGGGHGAPALHLHIHEYVGVLFQRQYTVLIPKDLLGKQPATAVAWQRRGTTISLLWQSVAVPLQCQWKGIVMVLL